MLEKKNVPAPTDEAIDRQIRDHAAELRGRAAAGLAGLAGWNWLRTRSKEDGLRWPLRRALAFNQRLAQAYFNDARLSRPFRRVRDARETASSGPASN